MSASTFQPPIHLDPNQDPSQQLAFINQNFQTIASTLETNSFRIVDRGLTTISSDGSSLNWSTIPHNLGFAPIPFAYLTGVTLGSISSNGNIPLPTSTDIHLDSIVSTALSGGLPIPVVLFRTWLEAYADDTNLYIVLLNANETPISNLDVQYYLCQQPSG